MAAGILSKPGTKNGPCEGPCQHRDCAETKLWAMLCCRICKERIGYDKRFYRERSDVPTDLTPEQQKIFADMMYGTAENNFKDAVGGCLFCNAPGGAGGCFKKRVIRGVTYLLLTQGWTQEEIEDELRVWMAYFFPGLAVKWATYYNQQGLDINDIPVDVATFSRQGKQRVEAALQGGDISSIPDQVGGCF